MRTIHLFGVSNTVYLIIKEMNDIKERMKASLSKARPLNVMKDDTSLSLPNTK